MDLMHVTWCPHPLRPSADRQVLPVVLERGDTLAHVLRRLQLGATLAVDVNGRAVGREAWASTPVRPRDVVVVRQAVAGAEVGAYAAAEISAKTSITLATASTIATVTAFAVNVAISLTLSALAGSLSSRRSSGGGIDTTPAAYSIAGGSNGTRQFAPLPVVLGEHRVFPDYASVPFTEFVLDPTTHTEVINNTPVTQERMHLPFSLDDSSPPQPISPWTLIHSASGYDYYGDNQARTYETTTGTQTPPHTFVVRKPIDGGAAEVTTYEDFNTPDPSTGGGGGGGA